MSANSPSKASARAEIQRHVTEELRLGDGRSDVYRRGMVAILEHRIIADRDMEAPYAPGTVEFDAFYAGVDRGHVLLQKLRSKGEIGGTAA